MRRPINQQHLHLVPATASASASACSSARPSTSTTQACAACRYQRRKCAPDCILAPYFPHDRQRQFQNAHKLFGVSNITKIIRDLNPPQKDEAMRTIIYQSDIRAHDPVGGCYRIITDLQRQIQFSTAQLHILLHHLAFCRNQSHRHHHDPLLIHGVLDSDINLYDHALDLHLPQITQQQQQQHHDEDDHHDIIGGHGHGQYMNSWANINNSPPSSSPLSLEVKPPLDDFKPLLINDIPAEETHDFKFEFDEINEPSEETLFNDANHKAFTKEENVSYQQHNEDNDLKGAATFFTLTNCSSY